MRPMNRWLLALLLAMLCTARPSWSQEKASPAVAATVESSLKSAPGQIRQFAFDGKADTAFVSAEDARRGDHLTLMLDQPVAVKSVTVTTGKADGAARLDAGTLEGSEDGKTFTPLAKFADGSAAARPDGKRL